MRRTAFVVLLFLLAAMLYPASLGSAQTIRPSSSSAMVNMPADFNNDGVDDLAVGVPTESVGSIYQAGAVNVLYGSTGSGISGAGSQLFTQPVSAVEAGDQFGSALASGDFNRDGFADLAVGAALENVGSTADAGAVSVLYGSSGGLTTSGGRTFTQVGGAVEVGDRFGSALATGDFNHDGFADLAAGAPLENVATAADAGAVSEVHGSATGLVTTSGWIHTERSFTGPESGDQFGSALAAGNFNAGLDDFTDLAVGVPFEGARSGGAVNFFYGGLLDRLFATFEDNYPLPSRVLSAGYFDGHAPADLAAGAPLGDVGSKVDAGQVVVLYNLVGDDFNTAVLTQDTPGVASIAEPGDHFGAALAAQ
jgi:hypothetical protein